MLANPVVAVSSSSLRGAVGSVFAISFSSGHRTWSTEFLELEDICGAHRDDATELLVSWQTFTSKRVRRLPIRAGTPMKASEDCREDTAMRKAAAIVACVGSAAAFTAPPCMQLRSTNSAVAANACASDSTSVLGRREMLGATLFGAGAIFASPQVASAKEVADGGLPPGIAEYMGVIKSKKQWNQIGKRVSEGKDDIPKEEWQNIQGFLRKFYDTGKDMESVSKAFSPDEQKAVQEVAKNFKKGVKAIDKPAAAQDWQAFMEQHKVLLGYIEDFQDIRAGKKKEVVTSAAGVPDEL